MNYGTFSFPKKSYDFDLDSTGTVQLTAAANIPTGAPVALLGNGAAPLPAPTAGTASLVLPDPSTTLIETTTGNQGTSAALLTSGNYVVAWTTAANTIKFAQYTSAGAIVGSITTVGAGNARVAVAALTSGNFVIAYIDGTNTRFAQYNASNTLVGSVTLVEAVGAAFVSVVGLTSGNFVVAYGLSATSVKFGQYNASNAIVGSLVTVEAASPASGISVIELVSGNFVVAYGVSSTSVKFGRYNTSNVLQGSLTTALTGAPSNGLAALALSNGNFVIHGFISYPRMVQYTSSGTLVNNPVIYSNASQGLVSLCQLTNGNIFVVAGDSTGLLGTALDNLTMRAVTPVQRILPFTNPGDQAGRFVVAMPNNNYVVALDASVFTVRGIRTFTGSALPVQTTLPYSGTGWPVDNTPSATRSALSVIDSVSNVNVYATAPIPGSTDVLIVTVQTSIARINRVNAFNFLQQYQPIQVDFGNNGLAGVAIAVLTNGNYVIASSVGSSVNQTFSIVSPTGVIVVDRGVYDSTAPTGAGVSVVALPNGGFHIYWIRNTASIQLAVFSANGTLLVGPTSIATGTPRPTVGAALLANGNVAVVWDNSTGSITSSQIRDAAGALVSGDIVVFSTSQIGTSVTALPTGGFIVAGYVGGAITLRAVTATNALSGSAFSPGSGVSAPPAICTLPNGNIAVGYQETGPIARLVQYTPLGVMVGSLTNIGAISIGVGSGANNAYVTANSAGDIFVAFQTSGTVSGVFVGASRAIMGQAVGGANATQLVRVRTVGADLKPVSGVIPDGVPVPSSVAFDHRSIGGISGNLSGNTIVMKGF